MLSFQLVVLQPTDQLYLKSSDVFSVVFSDSCFPV